ncbi:hypothetical protein LINPERHAP1_LOCUS19707, partial [Linum perenne]
MEACNAHGLYCVPLYHTLGTIQTLYYIVALLLVFTTSWQILFTVGNSPVYYIFSFSADSLIVCK